MGANPCDLTRHELGELDSRGVRVRGFVASEKRLVVPRRLQAASAVSRASGV